MVLRATVIVHVSSGQWPNNMNIRLVCSKRMSKLGQLWKTFERGKTLEFERPDLQSALMQ
eukprot:5802575-Karenia_brevis.AAC.1